MGRKKFLFVSAEKGDLKLTGDEHKAIRKLFPSNHKYVDSNREAYVSFFDLFALFESNKGQNDNSDIEILHFAGHSGNDGLLFDADNQFDALISAKKFKEFLSWYPSLKIVILNSCASKYVGEELNKIEHIEVVIETTDTIYEKDAILFTEYFYGFLDKGDEISEAFNKVELKFLDEGAAKLDRGKPREARNRKVKSEKFPWKIIKRKNKIWRLFKKVPDEPSENVRILHWYPYAEKPFRDKLSTSLENIYLRQDSKTEVYQSSLLKSKEDYEKLTHFDSVLIFLTEDFQKKWSQLDAESLQSIKECRVSVINCSGTWDDVERIKSDGISIEDNKKMPVGPMSIQDLVKNNSLAPLDVIDGFCKDGINFIHSKKNSSDLEIIQNELDNQFTSLNFKDQKILAREFQKFNLFVLEGTNECGHELCVRKILNNAGSSPLPNNTYSLTVKEIEDFKSSIDGFWEMLYNEIEKDTFVGDANDCVMTLLRQTKFSDVLLTIEYLGSEKQIFPIIQKFWSEFIKNKKVQVNTPRNRIFIFFLNKSYCNSTFSWNDTLSETFDNVLQKKFVPISYLEYETLESWFSNNLSAIKKLEKYKILKKCLSEKIQDKTPIGSVVKQICIELGVSGFEKEILSINRRYERS